MRQTTRKTIVMKIHNYKNSFLRENLFTKFELHQKQLKTNEMLDASKKQ